MRPRVAALLASLLPITFGFAPAFAQPFPPDSGALNVRQFGAKGDGTTDDTKALLTAIDAAGADTGPAFWHTRIVYLPAGTYRVSQPLLHHYANGKFASGMILIGDGPDRTTIRLADHATGFDDSDAPRGVIMTASKLLDGTPTSGGKDYTRKGEGNDAYENFVEGLTVDVGNGNPGAIGIDYLANNIGAIRDVHVVAPESSGAIGIAMQRKWPGPALLQRVEVQGFDTGLAIANSEYGMTLEHVRLLGARRVGLDDDGNAVAASDLTIATGGTPIVNADAGGMIVLHHATLRGSGNSEAFRNRGVITALDVTLNGVAAPSGARQPLRGVLQGANWQNRQTTLDLILPDAPRDDTSTQVATVLRVAQTDDKPQDITTALRQALASGTATIILPYGRYTITDAIDIPPTLRRIIGMNATLTVSQYRNPAFARDHGMFRITQPGPPLAIERLAFDMSNLGDQLAVEVAAQRDVTLRDIVTAGTSLLDRTPTGGRVFIEDVCCGTLHVAGAAPVYARQLDTEGGGTRIINDGAPLTILGIKTEGDCTVLDSRNGARSVILGGLIYPVHDTDPAIPAFRNSNAQLLAAFAEESLRAASRYTMFLLDSASHRAIQATEFPERGYGRSVPWLTASH